MPSNYALKFSKQTEDEFNNYNGFHETYTKITIRIQKYWSDTVGDFTNIGVAWSAVFVSFMVKSAGVTGNEFKFSASHAMFVHKRRSQI